MPRPSDLYANLGAPGVYQSTPWTPSNLPNVFLIPPAEDSQDVFCLFHSGSASPTAYDPFYGDPAYIQRDPSTPTVTNVAVLDQALSFIQHQATSSSGIPVFNRRSRWDYGDHVITSPTSLSHPSDFSPFGIDSSGSGGTALPKVRFFFEGEGNVDSQEEQSVPTRPASRRSSVFGERPSGHEIFSEGASEEDGGSRTKKSQGMSLRSRAALAFKAIGGTKARKTENDVLSEDEHEVAHRQTDLNLEQGTAPAENSKQHKRRTLAQLFGSSSSVNISAPYPDVDSAHLSPAEHSTVPVTSAKNSKLSKRKSMTQLFGFVRSPTVDTFEMQDAPAHWEQSSPSALRPSSPAPKLSKRKSMTQLFGLGRRASSTTALAAMTSTLDAGDDDDPHMPTAHARLAALRALEGPVTPRPAYGVQATNTSMRRSATAPLATALNQLPDTQIPPASLPLSENEPTRQAGRKSFLRARPFSFLHFASHPVSASQSQVHDTDLSPRSVSRSAPDPPSPPPETTDSSSNPTSTDSEPEVEDVVPILVPRLMLDAERNSDVPRWIDIHKPRNVDVESDDDGSSLELTARLDSLSFDQLTFDPDSFVGTAQI